VDGFVVGLHNLRNFIASHLLTEGVSVREHVYGVKDPPLSLKPLDQAVPFWFMVVAMATACGVTLASHTETKQKEFAALDKALTTIMQKYRVLNILSENAGPPSMSRQGPLNQLTLGLVATAVAAGRRVLWDSHESSDEGLTAMAQIHGFAAAVLRSLLLLGVPLHPRCLPLAAWAWLSALLALLHPIGTSQSRELRCRCLGAFRASLTPAWVALRVMK
jgi:hypothetical protein